ncbi:MAG: hypothetical protein B6244_02760 [Candidatus Cloacimonetes bacterium 4572_55]|nr:MAG: hypothetical protein B6244_02760 [Candidatus Cloacimonetes bacterium 4572_55]
MKGLKKLFLTTLVGGVGVILPVAILVFSFVWLFDLIQGIISPVTSVIISTSELPQIVADTVVILTIILVCFFIGLAVRTSVGRFLHKTVEKMLHKIPGYKLVKEIVLQFMGENESPFSSVALVKVFGNNTMMTAFVTDKQSDGILTVFVPTGPNPTSGNIYHLPSDQVIRVDASVEDAMRSIISCGMGSAKLFNSIQKSPKKLIIEENKDKEEFYP